MKNLLSNLKKVATLLLLIVAFSLQAQKLEWVNAYTNSTDISSIRGITTDASGNVYHTGTFRGTYDFDNSASTDSRTASGSFNDIFVQKLDANGNHTWVVAIGNTSSDDGRDVAVDASGNVYVTGNFTGTVDFDPSGTTQNLTSAGSRDVFVIKLNSSGALQWAYRGGGTGVDEAYAIELDASGNIYVVGETAGGDFDPGAGTISLGGNGSEDAFIIKLNNSGTIQWGRSVGSSGEDVAYDMALDQSDQPFVAGTYTGTVDFNTGAGTANRTSNGAQDAFVLYFNTSGTYQGVYTFGGDDRETANGLAIDENNNIYVGGTFDLTVDFDASASTANKTIGDTNDDFYVLKLTSSLTFDWVQTDVVSVTTFFSNDLDVDNGGNVYFGGAATGVSAGFLDIYDTDGNKILDGVTAYPKIILTVYTDGTYYYTGGYTQGNVHFDACDFTAFTGGSTKAFNAKYTQEIEADIPTFDDLNPSTFSGEEITLSISGNLNSATQWQWYSGSCGGTPIGTGTSIMVSPTVETTYYVRGEDYTCISEGSCASVTVTMKSPFISYGSYDLSTGVTLAGSFSVGSEESFPTDVAFNSDGTRMFIIGFNDDEIVQYSLNSAFDVGEGGSVEGAFSIASQDGSSTALLFKPDGTKMYMVGTSFDQIRQYSLTTPFDITSGVSLDAGSFSVQSQEPSPSGMTFNDDGSKIYVIGTSNSNVVQYSLNTPYDITAGGSLEGTFDLSGQEAFPSGLEFSPDGSRLFVVGSNSDRIRQYSLTTPYDVTSGVSYDNVDHYVGSNDSAPQSFTFNDDASRFYIVGSSTDVVFQYDLDIGGFTEASLNDGSVDGSLLLTITGETFTNGGSNLTSGADYSIPNLPTGLTPTIAVAGDGATATLTFTGTASNHFDAHDVTSLLFTFQNSAFTGNDASAVLNATSASSGFGIDFDDNNPAITYGLTYNISNVTNNGSYIPSQETGPTGVAFSNDGMKMFVVGFNSDAVHQYSLTTAFDITSGVSYDGSPFSITEDGNSSGITFNSTGSKMFIVGTENDNIYQYSLTNPFDITSGVSYDGSPFDLSGQESFPTGIAFSTDGLTMIMSGSLADKVHQYSLTTPFDVTSGVTFSGSTTALGGTGLAIHGIAFNQDGTSVFIADDGSNVIREYNLGAAFNITAGFTLNQSFSIGSWDGAPRDMAFNANGTKMYMVGGSGADINQFDLNSGGFNEAAANDGSVEGSLVITIVDDTFVNAGGNLTHGVDYTIANFPTGLTPNLAVAANGYSVTLTFSGNATYNQESNNLSELVFSFSNSAFSNTLAVGVANATSASSGFGIEFDDNPELFYSAMIDIASDVTYDGSQLSISESFAAHGIAFSKDGLKMFVALTGGDAIYQYSLASPFVTTSGVTYDSEVLDVSGEEAFVTDVTFNQDGTKLFIIGRTGREVNQYTLNTPFDLSGGVSFDGTPFSVSGEETDPRGLEFSRDGSKMFVVGFTGDDVNQYTLTNPFDITSGVTFDGTPFSVATEDTSPNGLAFNANGTRMFILGSANRAVFQYTLSNPYDITSGVSLDGSVSTGQDLVPGDVAFSTDGRTMFMAGANSTTISQYTLGKVDFIEVNANDGSVNGSMIVSLFGDTFINAAGKLASSTDYTIDNLPAGLTSTLTVASDGSSAVLTLGGNSTNHAHANDLSDLQFTFENSAFTNSNASEVGNSTSASSSIGIDFIEEPSIGDQTFDIDENSPNTTSIGTVIASDPDGTISGYSITAGNDLNGFSINPSDGEIVVNDFNVLDFETNSSFNLTVEVSDGLLTSDATITIDVNDVSEAPTGIGLDNLTIEENNAINATIGNLSTTDEDAGETYSYSLVSGTGDADNGSFNILGNALRASESFNFENKESYSIRVQTDDNNGGTYSDLFVISIADASEAPTDVNIDVSSINENNATNAVIGTLSTTDVDAGEFYLYSLVSGSGDEDNGSFTLFGSQLRAGEVFDFETKDSYSIRIQTDDQNGGTFSKPITINIGDINDNPTDVNLSVANVDENLAAGTTVGTLTSVDQDAGDSHTYTLKAGNTDNDSFTISGDQLLTNEVFDFETKAIYNLEIITDDGNGGTFEQEIAVNINDAPDAPTDIALNVSSINENNTINATIGTLTTTDVDLGETYTYTLVPGAGDTNNASFNISGDELRASENFNFEAQSSYSIRIQTNDGNGGNYSESFIITINNVLESPTDLSINMTSIQENNSVNAVIGSLSTTDDDIGDSHTYTLVSGSGDTGNSSFNISGNSLRASESFDFENQNIYSVRIQTNDGNGGLFAKSLTISITNQAEAPTDLSLSSSDIDESSPIGTTVGILSTTDEDNGETYTYTLVSGSGDIDNTSFTISGNELRSGEVFDFETKTSYSVRIQTNDGNGGMLSQSFTININDQPPGLTGVGITSSSVDENQSSGSLVGNLFALGDEIAGVNFTFTLVSGTGDTDNVQFSISGDQLLTSAPFDFESANQYSIRIMANDGAGSTIDQVLLVDVNDVNEAPTDLLLSANDIDENDAINENIGSLSTIDVDAGSTHTYSLVSGTGDSDNGSFNISGNSLRASESFNFETKSSYTVRIQTNDGNGGLYEKTFIIIINDASEAPTNLSLSVNSIDENNGINDVVGALSTTDEDAGETYAYTLVVGIGDEDNGSFNISGNDLRASESFDFETKSSYSVRIQTNDGNGGLFSKSITITVNDVNESPTDISLSSNTITENGTIGTVIGSFGTTDEDADQSHTYSLVTGTGDTDNASFSIIGNELISGEVFDFETKNNYSVRVQTSDGNGGVFAKAFSISINDVPPSVSSLDLNSSAIDENQPVGTVVGMLSTTGVELSSSVSYYLVAGTGDTDNASFTISGSNLLSNEVFDFETKDSYSVRIMTDDENGGVLEQAFAITINDDNDAPTDISLDNNSVEESNPIGSLIGSLSSIDEDGGQSHTYSLVAGTGDTDNASFSISGSNLVSGEVFDFEVKSSYSVRVQTNDGNGGTYEEVFTITISDLPASITSFTLNNNVVNENEVSGTSIGNFSTTGEDLSGNYTYTFETGTGDTDNASFSISGNQLLTAASFDFETQSNYSIRVMTDDGNQTDVQVFTIVVNDLSEAPTDISLSTNTIIENNAVNEVIGVLSTTDEDAGESYTYSFVTGTGDTDNASFNINGDELRASSSFDFEIKSGYSVRIQTNDSNGGTFEKSFIITIANANEGIVVVTAIADQSPTKGFGTLDIDLTNVFVDTDGDALTYLTTSSNTSVVTVSNSGAILTITEVGSGTSTITVTADDGSGITTSDDFLVTVVESLSTETDITAFSLTDQTGPAVIDATNHTINIEVATGTDVTNLTPTISVSAGATVSPSGSQDFTNPVTYTVTAEDGSTVQDWVVSATVEPEPLSNATDITDFSFNAQTGPASIDATNHTITIEVATGTDVTNLIPTISVSTGATISPSGAQDFTNPVTYTITAEDGSTVQDWVVIATVEPEPLSNATDITAFSFNEQTGPASIDATNHTITIEVATGTDVTNLTPTISVSAGATISPSGAQNFTNPMTYTVTAEDGSTVQDWVVTVSVEETPLGLDDEIQIEVYPNPTSNFIRVVSEQPLSIKVTDLKGSVYRTKSGNDVLIDVQSLSQGTYLLMLKGDAVNTTRRFIKIN